MNPKITVIPDTNLIDGESVIVKLTGFGVGGKTWLSECASTTDVTIDGCGGGLPEQPFLTTDNNRAGSGRFIVRDRAWTKSIHRPGVIQRCISACVLVATMGSNPGYPDDNYAYAGLRFDPTQHSSVLPSIGTNTPDRFVGQWFVHGAQMAIRSDMTGVITSNCGGGVCVETDRLTVVRSANGTRLSATITAISYTENTGKPIPNPNPNDSQAIGDSFYLVFAAPHLIKETIIHSSLPAIDQNNGDPYWCGKGLASSLVRLCGA